MTDRKVSSLYRCIEQFQGERPWGAVLDAGTGVNSIRWIGELSTDRWTAVTGSPAMADQVRKAAGTSKRPDDRILLGNWADPTVLNGDVHDTVIADYLLGAVEGFAPYFQPLLFPRLRALTRTTFYLTGLEPYVPTDRPDAPGARLIWEIGRFRDACVLLKGAMPYREYPAPWVVEQLRRCAFQVAELKYFKTGYKAQFVNAQIDIALHGLEAQDDPALSSALKARGEALRTEALGEIEREGALRGCRNYVIAAAPV